MTANWQANGPSRNAGPDVLGDAEISPSWPAHQAGDIGILVVETANENATLTSAQGFAEIPVSPQGTGTSGGTAATRLTVFWCRATSSSMPAPTVQCNGSVLNPVNHIYGRIITFRRCIETGDPWDVLSGDTVGVATTAVTVPGATTTNADCLVAIIVSNGTDTSPPQASAWANADLASVTEHADQNTTTGNGGGISVATGVKAGPGAYGTTTATLATASIQGAVTIALLPITVERSSSLDATGGIATTGTLFTPNQVERSSSLGATGGIETAGTHVVVRSTGIGATGGIETAGEAPISSSLNILAALSTGRMIIAHRLSGLECIGSIATRSAGINDGSFRSRLTVGSPTSTVKVSGSSKTHVGRGSC